jgi:hypothetical protein
LRPNWSAAVDLFAHALPMSAGIGSADHALVGSEVELREIDLEGDDVSIASRLWNVVGRPVSQVLCVITDGSFMGAGPMLSSASRIDDLIAAHASLFGCSYFGGDVIMFGPSTGEVIVVHHEVLGVRLEGRPLVDAGLDDVPLSD